PTPGFAVGGVSALLLGLVLLVATARQEAERNWRTFLINAMGVVGAVLIVIPVLLGVFANQARVLLVYLPGEGAVELLLGLFYVPASIALQESGGPAGFSAGLGLGAVGLVAIAGALTRSLMPESNFLVPPGLILMGAGVFFLATAAGVCLDWP